jgi:hypothetical protein
MKTVLPILAILSIAQFASAADSPDAAADHLALEMGRAMLAVDRALAYDPPENPSAEQQAKSDALNKALIEAGQDTRWSKWIYGRLEIDRQEIESWLRDTHPDEARTRQLKARLERLAKLKFLIDAPH